MSWNNRVVLEKYEYNGSTEYNASIREVYYGSPSDPSSASSTENDIAPHGSSFESELDAVKQLRIDLLLMIEAVDFVLGEKTKIFIQDDVSTYDPGAKSVVSKKIF